MNKVKSFEDKFGKITLFELEKGTAFLVRPEGFIRLTLLKKYLRYIKALDYTHTIKYHHIVDTSEVKFANPLNPIYLRAIRNLKNVNLYIVIVPSNILRTIINLTKWINRPNYVLKSVAESQKLIGSMFSHG